MSNSDFNNDIELPIKNKKKNKNKKIKIEEDSDHQNNEIVIDDPVINNWTKENTDVVLNWKTNLSKIGFICQVTMETNQNFLTSIQILALLFSSISTIMSGVSSIVLSVNNSSYALAGLILNIILFFVSTTVSFLTGIIKIFHLNENINTYSSYIAKVD